MAIPSSFSHRVKPKVWDIMGNKTLLTLDLSDESPTKQLEERLKSKDIEALDLKNNNYITNDLSNELIKLINPILLCSDGYDLTAVPAAVMKLPQLEVLVLRNHKNITMPMPWPDELYRMNKLKVLRLYKCNLATIPQAVLKLTQLEKLDLSWNSGIHLPDELSGLTNIRVLKLRGIGMVTVPPVLWRLVQLELLDLSWNPVQTLPAEIKHLSNLKHLSLLYCMLHTLPPEVGRLAQLEWLNLRSNPLQTLPAEIGQLINVKYLDLSGCELRTLPPEVGRLTQLEWLDLSSNALQTLPAEIGQFTNVKHLDLSQCQLSTLPPEIWRLTQLEWLDLSHNSLQALPAETVQLRNACHLDVSGNPLIKPPAEVCRQGIVAIRQYFDELERSEEEVSASLKVVVLGEKMAGKTSLVQTLGKGQSFLTEEEERTHCVQITQWAPDDNITFEVYDFGGYDVYHLTHQFFLTQGALNLLTVNLHEYRCTEQSYTEAVGFWLDTLNARVPEAVVTIVGSKTDLCSGTEIEEKTRDIRERFTQQHNTWQRGIQQQIEKLQLERSTQGGADPEEIEQQLERTRDLLTRPLRLTGVYCVSSAEPTSGLNALKNHIMETANDTSLFPSLRRILPRTWVDFEHELHDLPTAESDLGYSSSALPYAYGSADSDIGYSPSLPYDYSQSLPYDYSESLPYDYSESLPYDYSASLPYDRATSGHRSSALISHRTQKWLMEGDCLMLGQLAGLSSDRLEPVLSYLQQVGTILRYTEIPELKDLVFHDPSGLIDIIKELFHHDLKKVFTNKKPHLKGFSNTYLKKIRKNLSSRGFLPREVAIALLGPHATSVGNVDVITDLLKHFGLCYTERSDDQDEQAAAPVGYFIPWYIREEKPKSVKRGVRKRRKKGFTLTCEIARFCPQGLFERLSVVVTQLIKSQQDIIASSSSSILPVIVRREPKDQHVNIIVNVTVPAQAVQGTQVDWDVISPLKDKLFTLLKEWPGLLYLLVDSTFTQQAKQKGDSQTLSVPSIIPTFAVGPGGRTVKHGGVTLEFPAGCVRDTRFISVEVEAVPVTEDVRSNLTAMSAVLTVEQDFPQRFLRPVTVRLPWVWTQAAAGKETTTVVLHHNHDKGWTVFQTDTHGRGEDGGIMFQTDHFQIFWVLEVLWNCGINVISWAQQTQSDYNKDKSYIIVTPLETERLLHLICLSKSDNLTDLKESPGIRFDSRTKRRVTLKQGQWIEATSCQHEDAGFHPRDLPIVLSPPETTREVRLVVRESVPIKDVYHGKVQFVTKGSNLDRTGERQQFETFVQLRQRQQLETTETSVQENEHPEENEHPDMVEGHENTGLNPHQHHQARSEGTDQPRPRTRRPALVIPCYLAMTMIFLVAIVAVLCKVYFAVNITGFFGLPDGREEGLQHMSYSGKPVVLLVNDEYGTSKGGISTINRQLAKLLRSSGAQVLCTVLNASKEDVNDARTDGVELVFPTSFKEDIRQPTLDWLTWDHQTRYPNLSPDITHIIGHASITSRAARNIKEQRYPAAKLILFNHVIPEDTEHHKSESNKSESRVLGIGEKIDAIREDTGHADVVFSVGPNLYDYYKNQIRSSKPHYEFLPSPSDIFSQMNATYVETETKVVLSIGRVKGAERLKGYDLAAKTMSMVIDRFPKARWRVRGVSAEDFPRSKEIIQANVEKGTFHFTPLKYGTHSQLVGDLKEVHVVLMPSRAEPFGLVGLETIAAGVPVLVSSKSGLAEFLESKGPEFDRPIVDIDGSDDVVAERLAKRIIKILKGGRAEFEAAKRLKDKLLASEYWNESHRKFLEECGIPQ